MPLALLLQERLGVITGIADDMAPLSSVFDRAELVLRRRQGAFLGQWFGPGLRVDGLDLRVAVVNAGAIQARVSQVRAVQAQYERETRGPNLLEPVAGMAGVLAGMLVGGLLTAVLLGSVVFGIVGIIRRQFRFFRRLGSVLTGPFRGYSAWAELRGTPSPSGFLTWYETGRTGAEWAAGLTSLASDVLGPRARVGNPVLRAVLDLLDRLAGLVAQLLGAVATFLHLLPVLRALRGTVEPLRGLLDVARAVVEAAVGGLIDAVSDAVRGSGMLAILAVVRKALHQTVKAATKFVMGAVSALRRPFAELAAGLRRGWDAVGAPTVEQVISRHPVMRLVRLVSGSVGAHLDRLQRELGALFPRIRRRIIPGSVRLAARAVGWVAGKISSLLGSGSSGSPSPGGGTWSRVRGWLAPNPLPTVPTPPPSATAVLGPSLVEAASDEVSLRPFHIVGARPRVFPAERARLEQRYAEARADPAYRAATTVLLGAAALVGSEVDREVRKLSGRLDRIEDELRRRPAPRLPVRDLPPPRRLVPVFRRVRVTGDRRSRHEVSAWVDEVLTRLGAAPVGVEAVR